MDKTIPRGIRNNNPLNIRVGNSWRGEVECPTDKDFEQFKEMRFGIRAGFILLKRYIERYHLTTITDIISRWAPPSENKTAAYIANVSKLSGIGVLEELDFKNMEQMFALVDAMIQIECGCHIPKKEIIAGYNMVYCLPSYSF